MSCAPKGTTGFVSIIRNRPPRNKAFSGGVMNHHPYFLGFRWHWEEVAPQVTPNDVMFRTQLRVPEEQFQWKVSR